MLINVILLFFIFWWIEFREDNGFFKRCVRESYDWCGDKCFGKWYEVKEWWFIEEFFW